MTVETDLLDRLELFRGVFERDRFAGAALRGSLPCIPLRTALPTASKEYEGCLTWLQGATGVASVVYVCLKSAADTYSWKAAVTG